MAALSPRPTAGGQPASCDESRSHGFVNRIAPTCRSRGALSGPIRGGPEYQTARSTFLEPCQSPRIRQLIAALGNRSNSIRLGRPAPARSSSSIAAGARFWKLPSATTTRLVDRVRFEQGWIANPRGRSESRLAAHERVGEQHSVVGCQRVFLQQHPELGFQIGAFPEEERLGPNASDTPVVIVARNGIHRAGGQHCGPSPRWIASVVVSRRDLLRPPLNFACESPENARSGVRHVCKDPPTRQRVFPAVSRPCE